MLTNDTSNQVKTPRTSKSGKIEVRKVWKQSKWQRCYSTKAVAKQKLRESTSCGKAQAVAMQMLQCRR